MPLPSSQGCIKDELLALSAELSNARSECSRVGDSFVKRGDLEDRLKALSKESLDLDQQITALTAEQQPRAAQREVMVREREAARRAAGQKESEVEVRLREVQQLADQMSAKVWGAKKLGGVGGTAG